MIGAKVCVVFVVVFVVVLVAVNGDLVTWSSLACGRENHLSQQWVIFTWNCSLAGKTTGW